mmetsp:Transcript_1912/g.4616  ORF Transcript_1912/g.4616 Transcript_1912/m.4616 type:complete len:215 (-) Transcript_1912:173-817(-)
MFPCGKPSRAVGRVPAWREGLPQEACCITMFPCGSAGRANMQGSCRLPRARAPQGAGASDQIQCVERLSGTSHSAELRAVVDVDDVWEYCRMMCSKPDLIKRCRCSAESSTNRVESSPSGRVASVPVFGSFFCLPETRASLRRLISVHYPHTLVFYAPTRVEQSRPATAASTRHGGDLPRLPGLQLSRRRGPWPAPGRAGGASQVESRCGGSRE